MIKQGDIVIHKVTNFLYVSRVTETTTFRGHPNYEISAIVEWDKDTDIITKSTLFGTISDDTIVTEKYLKSFMDTHPEILV